MNHLLSVSKLLVHGLSISSSTLVNISKQFMNTAANKINMHAHTLQLIV